MIDAIFVTNSLDSILWINEHKRNYLKIAYKMPVHPASAHLELEGVEK